MDFMDTQKLSTYFKAEWKVLLIVTITGILYNVGLLATPWFEGQLAQTLLDIFQEQKTFHNMAILIVFYVGIISFVQLMRALKRLEIRVFANHVSKKMKHQLFEKILHLNHADIQKESIGNMMTKAITDVDSCVEGMRKFTTEIFDTGIALLSYITLLLIYDYKLALLCFLFPPISYILAEYMKKVVQKTTVQAKKSTDRLNTKTIDRIQNAFTYRINGMDDAMIKNYEESLNDYEKTNRVSSILINAMPPIYLAISNISILFIFYFGSKRIVSGVWNIAIFTTFLSCYTKMATKSSKAAKLFNNVHKAQVSWKRIQPLLKQEDIPNYEILPAGDLEVDDVSFAYPQQKPVFSHTAFTAKRSQIIAITGPIASGKSTLGRMFLMESPYTGSIRYNGQELSQIPAETRNQLFAYLGHDPELFTMSIKDNILMGKDDDIHQYLKVVMLEEEINAMSEKENTIIGNYGTSLSGGQGQRIALARTLASEKPVLILDDPFSALDKKTEQQIFENMKPFIQNKIVILISHRLYLFSQMDQVLFIENGTVETSTHEHLMQNNSHYREMFELSKGESHEK